MAGFTPLLWLVLPLSLAAGLDLYLTLLLLGLAPWLPWWEHPLPGGLSDLNAVPIVAVMAVMYAAEVFAERRPTSYLGWNAAHAFIRPMSGALLAALLLHGSATGPFLVGVATGGLLTFLAHAVRSGGVVLRDLDPTPGPAPVLVRILEDVLVLGLVTGSLDAPSVAVAGAGVVASLGVPGAPSRIRAFAFTTRLAAARVFQAFRRRRWIPTEELPEWVRAALEGDAFAIAGGLRGARVGVVGLRGAPRFVVGWLVVTGRRAVFVRGPSGGDASVVDLRTLNPRRVAEEAFYRTLDLAYDPGARVRLLFFVDGPGAAALAAEFGVTPESSPGPAPQENL